MTAAASTAHGGELKYFKLEESYKRKEMKDWRHRKSGLLSPTAHRAICLNLTDFKIRATAQTLFNFRRTH